MTTPGTLWRIAPHFRERNILYQLTLTAIVFWYEGTAMNASQQNDLTNYCLKNFINDSYKNTNSTINNLTSYYNRLDGIHKAYRKIIANIDNSDDWFSAFFLFRAHSSFLASVQLSTSGQLPEAYMVQRGCLEDSLYGLYFHKHPELRETWLRRHDNKQAKRKVKNVFRISILMELLKSIDPKLGDIIHNHYEQTIDYGAHTNERSLTTALKQQDGKNKTTFKYNYFNNSQLAFELCLKTNARVGVGSLLIFKIIFKTRFELLGISYDLQRLCDGL